MTQAFNLAQLANNINTSGQLDATDGLSGLVANSNLASSGTANSSTFLRGDRTWATVQSSGRILNRAFSSTGDPYTYSGSGWYSIDIGTTLTGVTSTSWVFVTVQVGRIFQQGFNTLAFRVLRNGTPINVGNQQSNRIPLGNSIYRVTSDANHAWDNFMIVTDTSPANGSNTYQVQVQAEGGGTWNMNRNGNYTDGGEIYNGIGFSCITALEIGA